MNNAFHQQVNQRLLFPTAPKKKASVAILLGAKGVSGDIAREAALDYLSTICGLTNYFNKIIISGGRHVFQPHVLPAIWSTRGTQANITDFFSLRKEADYMRKVLIDGGVDPQDIICVDNTSTNTGENFANIRNFIRAENIASANVYSVANMSRRAVETCAWQIPELQSNPVGIYPYGLSREKWLERWPNTGIQSIVIDEYEKINPRNPNNFYAPQRSGKKKVRFSAPLLVI